MGIGTHITYDAHSHPYWFTDTAENYNAWTSRLLKATYNYQTSMKDPGAFAHGGKYIIQVLYDSLANLGTQVTVDMTGMVRPEG